MDPPEQGNELEWEDEDTKNRFLPSIKPVSMRYCPSAKWITQ
ncbi:unnamed protein product [Arabidopsis thaliana]|nr:unnamed protein product [Arabidopsis thaliana]